MLEYRRAFAPGGTFFFTVVTYDRAPILCTPLARDILRGAIARTRERRPFTLDAIVLLPDHLHAICTLPEDDADFSTRWAMIKREFSANWLAAGGHEGATAAPDLHDRRRGVWQRRFWEHTIRDERDFERHIDYIHYNPVKHGLVPCPHAWQHSSFERWVRERAYDADWQCACNGRSAKAPSFDDLDTTAME
jgi:putative transposase